MVDEGGRIPYCAMHVRLASSPQVLRPDGGSIPLAPRDAALLAWLALEGPTPRTRLAALLWPDSEAEAARNALRQRLFQLRRQFGDALLAGTDTLSLATGLAHDLADSDGVLADVQHDFGPELLAWLQQQRQRRQLRVQQSIAELADMAERAGDYDDALHHAHELLALSPLSEESHRRLMRVHYLRGDRAAALLAFDRCEQVLKDEIGARPSAETLALLATVEAAQPAAAPPADGRLPASVLRPPRLIGREAELAALTQGWRGGQVVALIGEAGLGKTRLLQTFAEARPGVVRAAGRPGDAGVPFATLARLLRGVLALPRDAQAMAPKLAASTRHEIARVLPEFDAGAGRHGEGQRLVLERAVRDLLASQPGLSGLIVDDLHFADDASLDMLGALIDGDEGHDAEGPGRDGAPLRWVLAYRPAEAGSPVRALHDSLVEQTQLAPVTLPPLGLAALAALVDSLGLPGIVGEVLAPGLLRRTGGNPLFVLETLKQAWVERTLAELADARMLPRPVSVGRLIERRVMQLSPGALALARVASIAGVDFGIGLAERVLGVSAMQLADALNELESAQVLRGTQFAHDLVFDAVRDSVPEAIAQHTHAHVAQWLERHGGEPARVARHWVAAQQPARALPWLTRAAEAAGAALRRKEQIAFIEQRSRIEEAAGDRHAAFASQMLAAELHVTLDDEAGHGAEQCDRLDALAGDATERIQARLQRAHRAYMRGELALAERSLAETLRDALREGVPADLVIECRQHLATALSLQDRASEAVAQFEAAMSWIDEHASDERRCDFHGNLALTYDNCGRLADSLPHHEIAIGLAQRLGHHNNLTMCLSNYAANRILGGHLREGEHLLVRMRQVQAQADEASSVEGFAAMLQAVCDYQSGRYRAALSALAASEAQLARFAPGFRRGVWTHQAVCWAQLGQWSRLQQLLASMGEFAQLPPATQLRLAVLLHHMDRALDRRPTALIDEVLSLVGPHEVPDMRHMLQMERAVTLAPDECLARLEAVIDGATRLGHDGTLVAAHARAARAAGELGEGDRARRHARAALALSREAGMVRQYPAELWLHCGAAYLAVGDAAAARETLAAGRAWVMRVADEEVPGEFRDGFLQRNLVNRELLGLAARSAS